MFRWLTNLNCSTENLNKALEYYEKARRIRENNKDKLGLAKTYNNIGNVYFYMSLGENKNEDNLQKAQDIIICHWDYDRRY